MTLSEDFTPTKDNFQQLRYEAKELETLQGLIAETERIRRQIGKPAPLTKYRKQLLWHYRQLEEHQKAAREIISRLEDDRERQLMTILFLDRTANSLAEAAEIMSYSIASINSFYGRALENCRKEYELMG